MAMNKDKPSVLMGEDKRIRIDLKDRDGKVIPISNLTGILVYLVYKETGNVLQKYSLNSKQDFEDIEVIDDPNGIIEVHLQSSTTSTGSEGSVYYELKISETDNDFANNSFFTAYVSPVLFNLVNGESKGENPA